MSGATYPHQTIPIDISPQTAQSILRNVLRARCGQLWNLNMADGQKIPHIRGLWTATFNACPLCFLVDSGSHLLGGCRRRDIIKSYIKRHHEAGILITKTVKQGANDINVFTADGKKPAEARSGSSQYILASLAGS